MSFENLSLQSQRLELAAALLHWGEVANSELPLEIPRLSFTDSNLLERTAAVLAAARAARLARYKQLASLPAGKWMDSQREINTAFTLAIGRRAAKRMTPVAPDFRGDAMALIERAEQSARRRSVADFSDGPDKEYCLYTSLSMRRNFRPDGWWAAVVAALAEYLTGGAAERLIQRYSDYDKTAAQFLASIRQFQEIAVDMNSLGVRFWRPTFVERMGRIAEEIPTRWPHYAAPLTRRSEGQDEKLFVYRIFMANKKEFRAPRSEAIYELMHMQLFKRQFDRRHVDRLVAEFTAKFNARMETTEQGKLRSI